MPRGIIQCCCPDDCPQCQTSDDCSRTCGDSQCPPCIADREFVQLLAALPADGWRWELPLPKEQGTSARNNHPQGQRGIQSRAWQTPPVCGR